MGLVSKGDIKKSSVLFERYHLPIYNYFLKMSRDSALAKDMTQNVFEKMIKYHTSYKNNKNFKGWLFTIARNVKIDHHRSQKMKYTDDTALKNTAAKTCIQGDLEKSEKRDQLFQAMDRLKADEKELLILAKFEKFKYSEVSEMLGLSESAIKVKIHRVMKKLRTILIKEIRYEH